MDAKSIKNCALKGLIVSYGVSSTRYTRNLGVDQLSHLQRCHAKFGISDSSSTIKHFALLPKKTPAFLITHYVKTISYALNSDGGRRRKFDPNPSEHPSRSPSNPYPCYLCSFGDLETLGDNTKHIYQNCKVMLEAWSLLLAHPSGPKDTAFATISKSKTSPIFFPDYRPASAKLGYNRLSLVMCFCWAVHSTIGQIRMGRSPMKAGDRILALTLSLRYIWAPTVKASSKYGSASSRTPQQKELALNDATHLIEHLPKHAIIVYSDGSALGNPGPAGAGAVITYHQPESDPITCHLLHPLGFSTNNAGELWGLGMALSHILEDRLFRAAARLSPIFLLTDSLWSTSSLDRGFSKDAVLNSLVVAILALIDRLEVISIRRPRRYWIPGHVEIEGNVIADALALQGSELSNKRVQQSIAAPSENCLITFTGGFTYFKQMHGRLYPY